MNFQSLYWIPQLHYRRCIVGSVKCSTKPLSKLLTIVLSAVKTRPKSYGGTSYSMDIGNQTWILIFFNVLARAQATNVRLVIQ